MKSKISPKGDNIVGVRYKRNEKSLNNVRVVGIENDDTVMMNVIAIGKDCNDTNIGDILLVPLSSIRVVVEGSEYILCSERSVYGSLNV